MYFFDRFAAKLSEQRRQLLTKQYVPLLGKQTVDRVFEVFDYNNLAEYSQWALNRFVQQAGVMKNYVESKGRTWTNTPNGPVVDNDPSIPIMYGLDVQKMVGEAEYFHKSKTIGDPRIQKMLGGWDLNKVNHGQLSRARDRYPEPMPKKSLFLDKHPQTAQVVRQEEINGADWQVVSVDFADNKQQIEEQLREIQASVPPAIAPFIKLGSMPYSVKVGLMSSAYEQDENIMGLLKQWFEQLASNGCYIRTRSERPMYGAQDAPQIYPPAALQFMKACRMYANNNEWCTSDFYMSSGYLTQEKIWIILKDGVPVAQYHGESKQLKDANDDDLEDSKLLDQNDVRTIHELLGDHTGFLDETKKMERMWDQLRENSPHKIDDSYYQAWAWESVDIPSYLSETLSDDVDDYMEAIKEAKQIDSSKTYKDLLVRIGADGIDPEDYEWPYSNFDMPNIVDLWMQKQDAPHMIREFKIVDDFFKGKRVSGVDSRQTYFNLDEPGELRGYPRDVLTPNYVLDAFQEVSSYLIREMEQIIDAVKMFLESYESYNNWVDQVDDAIGREDLDDLRSVLYNVPDGYEDYATELENIVSEFDYE